MTHLLARPPAEHAPTCGAGPQTGAQSASRRELFAALYRSHYAQIAGYLYRRTGHKETAEDLAGDTFVDAYRAFWRFRVTGAPVSAWFYTIATNKANAWARRVKRGELQAPEPTPEPGESVLQRERTAALYRALRALSPEHQAVIALVRFESLTHKDAARALGVRVGTIKSRLNRAMESLREELAPLGDHHA